MVTGRIAKRNYNSKITIGNDYFIEAYIALETDRSEIQIKDNVFIGRSAIVDSVKSICIDSDVLISYKYLISSNNHSISYSIRKNDLMEWRNANQHDWSTTLSEPIRICKGARSIILKGVTIGESAVIGAGSVVTKDVPPWTIVAANPVRVIKEIPENER